MQFKNEDSLRCVSYAIPLALLPYFVSNDIVGVRLVRPRPPRASWRAFFARPLSFIVQLSKPEMVREIMRARRSYNHNYFTSKDKDPTLLDSETAGSLPDCRIFVNEILSMPNLLEYLSHKTLQKR